MRKSEAPRYRLEIEAKATADGKIGPATVVVLGADGRTVASDKGDLSRAAQRDKIGRSLAKQLGDEDSQRWLDALAGKWGNILDQQRAALNGSAEGVVVGTVELLDDEPKRLRRPLTLIDGVSYAAAWANVTRSKDGESVTGTELVIVRGDGQLFADAPFQWDTKPIAEIGAEVRLPSQPPPGRGWSGGGFRRFLDGERPGPAEAFERVASVVDRFLDFDRSLAEQQTMCELTACYIMATYFTEGLNTVGYLWSNGERGCGKTTFIQLATEIGYLGSLILAGSYPTLRDMADYGATLAFDDAEAVMDVRKTDPDKRTLLLAGARRGANVAMKELSPDGKTWQTRYVDTFCPRLFRAIKLPDSVLASRSLVIPLIRSGDPVRAKSNPANLAEWPTDRRRLVDDLWAVGLEHLPVMPRFDALAAERATLCGRNLDPWRGILAVALWLEHQHGVKELYVRMEQLSRDYQRERSEIEDNDRVRVLYRALLRLLRGKPDAERVTFFPKEIASEMNRLAEEESLGGSAEHPFVKADGVGRILKSQWFDRAPRAGRGQPWIISRAEVVRRAAAFGVVPEADNASEPEGARDDEATF